MEKLESVWMEEWIKKVSDPDTHTPWDEIEKNVAESQRHDLLMGVIRRLKEENGTFPRHEIAKRIDRTDNMTGQILKNYGINLMVLKKEAK
jgi:hypothetical protein